MKKLTLAFAIAALATQAQASWLLGWGRDDWRSGIAFSENLTFGSHADCVEAAEITIRLQERGGKYADTSLRWICTPNYMSLDEAREMVK